MAHIFTDDENRTWLDSLPGKKCSACIAMIDNDCVLMVKASYKDSWTFPSGVVEENESPLTTALRETKEEVGIQLSPNDVEFLTVVYTPRKDGFRDRFNFVFITNRVSQTAQLTLQPEEIEAAEWVPFAEVANKAGQRGSYQIIERLLLGDGQSGYQEVNNS